MAHEAAEVVDEFAHFWARYPRRVAKQDAIKAWGQLKPTAAVIEQIHAALDWQIPGWDDPQYVPYPASWLRGRRFEDEQPAESRRRMPSRTGDTMEAGRAYLERRLQKLIDEEKGYGPRTPRLES